MPAKQLAVATTDICPDPDCRGQDNRTHVISSLKLGLNKNLSHLEEYQHNHINICDINRDLWRPDLQIMAGSTIMCTITLALL